MTQLLSVLGLLVAVSVAVQAAKQYPDTKDKVKAEMFGYLMACQKSTGMTDDEMKVFKESKTPISSKEQCFVGCFLDKAGIIENGAFSDENSKALSKAVECKSTPEEREEFSKCASQVPANNDLCVTGPAIAKCMPKTMGGVPN